MMKGLPRMALGSEALRLALALDGPVLDVGAGPGEHARAFLDAGRDVVAVDLRAAPFCHSRLSWAAGDFMQADLEGFGVVWCCHVLEHLPDVGAALAKMRRALAADGSLVLTVPPMKPQIVGGHVNLFNLGLLAYRLILAGFDCSGASFGSYGYNLSAVVRRDAIVPASVLAELAHDAGDIERLAAYFPPAWRVKQGFDGANVPAASLFR